MAEITMPSRTPQEEQLDRIEELLASLHYIVDVQGESIKEMRNQMRLLLDGARVH
jgi:predicted secreted protein